VKDQFWNTEICLQLIDRKILCGITITIILALPYTEGTPPMILLQGMALTHNSFSVTVTSCNG